MCDSYDWNGETYTASGTYTFETTNAVGCDSIATLNLTINNTDSITVNEFSCEVTIGMGLHIIHQQLQHEPLKMYLVMIVCRNA